MFLTFFLSFQAPVSGNLAKKFKSKAKTTLQVRSEEERTKQITETVMAILSCETDISILQECYVFLPSRNSKLHLGIDIMTHERH